MTSDERVPVVQWHLAEVRQLQAIAAYGIEEMLAARKSRQQCLPKRALHRGRAPITQREQQRRSRVLY
jgi:hypothetical protein